MTTILITGGAGYLAQALLRTPPPDAALHITQYHTPPAFLPEGAEVHPVDLCSEEAVEALWAKTKPSLVIHTAYRRDGPRLEADTVDATATLAAAAARYGSRLLHISTDALFAGRPWPYTEADEPDPLHAYGRAKAAAERAVRHALPPGQRCIVRTSLILGSDLTDTHSQWVIESVREGRPITLFTDELRTPIGVTDLAAALWELAGWEEWPDVLHIAGPEAISRYALGLLVLARAGLPTTGITPGLCRAFPTPRPCDVRLDSAEATRRLRQRLRPISEFLTA